MESGVALLKKSSVWEKTGLLGLLKAAKGAIGGDSRASRQDIRGDRANEGGGAGSSSSIPWGSTLKGSRLV